MCEDEFMFFADGAEDLSDQNRRFTLSKDDIALLSPNTGTCPTFRSKRDMEITRAVYTRVPILMKEEASEENSWHISLNSMFHMTNDSHLFRSRKQLETDEWRLQRNTFRKHSDEYLPLYERKMIFHF